jgi:hypothetical protein
MHHFADRVDVQTSGSGTTIRIEMALNRLASS